MKLARSIVTMIVLSLGLCFGVAKAAPIFVNGGFEVDSWAPGQTNHVTPSGWSAVQSSDSRFVQGVHNTASTTAFFTPFGSQFIILCAVDCQGGTIGNVSQVVSGFIPGAQYRLDFQQSPEIDSQGGTFDALVSVTIAGIVSSTSVFSAISAGIPGNTWADWKPQSLTFTADSSTLTFTFAGAIDGVPPNLDIESGIDNIGITELTADIPEPASVLLVGFGVGLLGLRLGRKKNSI